MLRSLLVLLGTLLIFPTLSAASPEDAETHAIKVAESWLMLVDQGKHSESWKESASYFRSMVTEQQWIATAEKARKPLGKLLSRKVSTKKFLTSLQGAPEGEYVVVVFESNFENKSGAIETVTPMKDKDGTWRVSGYYIR